MFTGYARPDEMTYASLASFEITSGFVVGGVNTLEFRTVNMPTGAGKINPNGLLVTGLELEMGSAIPAPGAVLLVSLGTCAVGFIRRKGIL